MNLKAEALTPVSVYATWRSRFINGAPKKRPNNKDCNETGYCPSGSLSPSQARALFAKSFNARDVLYFNW